MEATTQVVKCRIVKRFGGYKVGEIVEFPDGRVLWRRVRNGQVKPITENRVDRTKLGAIPPTLGQSVRPRPQGERYQVKPVRPENTPSVGPVETPGTVSTEIVPAARGWYLVIVDGEFVTKKDGSLRNFRAAEADEYVKNL